MTCDLFSKQIYSTALVLLVAAQIGYIGLNTGVEALAAQPHTKSAKAGLQLYGHIDELSYVCSAAGVKLTGARLPAQITKIALGSAAAYSGLQKGDRVLHAEMNDNILHLTVERKGKIYRAGIATDVRSLKAAFEARKIKFSFGDSAFDDELRTLSNCEIFILLDRCATMNDSQAGVPGDLSKWMWCKQQIDNLYLATERVLDKGFNLVLFNDKYQQRSDVTLWDLKQVFDQIKPDGTRKNIAAPLEAVIDAYLKRAKPESKPLVVLVITEGTENVGTPLQSILINTAKRITYPGQISVAFLQVGTSISAEDLFDDLDRNLIGKGAKYDIASYKTFAELRNKGLLSQLLSTVKEATTNGSNGHQPK